MAESEEELKSFLMRVKEKSEKAGLNLSLKTNEQKQNKAKLRSWYLVPSLHGKLMGKKWEHDKFYFLGLQNHCGK